MLLASVLTLGVQQLLQPRNAARIERLKLFDKEILDAYKALYSFTDQMSLDFCPPGEISRDFMLRMKLNYYPTVKPNLLLYSKDIRVLLSQLEVQYNCLCVDELIPPISFEEFVDQKIMNLLATLKSLTEKATEPYVQSFR